MFNKDNSSSSDFDNLKYAIEIRRSQRKYEKLAQEAEDFRSAHPHLFNPADYAKVPKSTPIPFFKLLMVPIAYRLLSVVLQTLVLVVGYGILIIGGMFFIGWLFFG